MLTEKEKMLAGELYAPADPELAAARLRARQLCHRYNLLPPEELSQREETIRQLLGATGERFNIEPNFRCDYGSNIYLGEDFYANFDLIILDVCEVHIGKNCMCAPRVQILTATHPLDPTERNSGLEFGSPITIGDNCWIGAGAIINPGVKIGDAAVIGAGAVVTKDVPSRTVVAGVPAKVIRAITP
ncbi:sugar O-acetyltransferase [Cerasicoccus frondis]|uniref:sugar O-acetyltransferase n=1 Tax=Cerasicoccus frondis TaxID=490090 RepID=UPI0031B87ECE